MNRGSTAAPAARISGDNQELTVKDKRHKGLPQRGSVISTHVWVGVGGKGVVLTMQGSVRGRGRGQRS